MATPTPEQLATAQLARELNTMQDRAVDDGDAATAAAILDRMRSLHREHPEQAAVRETLAEGLSTQLTYVPGEPGDPERRALMRELRDLRRAHPEDPTVRRFAVNVLIHALCIQDSDEPLRREALLLELRGIREEHPDDLAVAEFFVLALADDLSHLRTYNDMPRRAAVLAELESFHRLHPRNVRMRRQLATGLVSMLYFTAGSGGPAENGGSASRDAYLERLRELHREWPEDDDVRRYLAMGLVNMIGDATEAGDQARRAALLAELTTVEQGGFEEWDRDALG